MTHKNPDPNRLTPVDATRNTGAGLKGVDVINKAGERIGTIADFVLTGDGQIDSVVVETFGVFGIGARHVPIRIDRLDLLVDPYEKFFLRVDMPQTASGEGVETAPTAAAEPPPPSPTAA